MYTNTTTNEAARRINETTRKHQNIARKAAEFAYNNRRWTYGDIFDAYERPSRDKVNAWEYCQRLCADLNGWDLLIASKNTFQFSAVFTFADPETGELGYAYITRDYDRYCYASTAAQAATTTAAALVA